MEKIAYLKKYNPDIEIVTIDKLSEEQITELPLYWKDAMSQSSIQTKKEIILGQWEKFPYQFKSTINYLKGNLVNVELIIENSQFALLYTIKNNKGDDIYYIGFNPASKKSVDYFDKLPDSFKEIYNHLHNGWVYYASKSNGLLPIEDTIILGQEEWGILEELDLSTLAFNLDNCIGLFDNGQGDYASIDLKSNDKKDGFIWWHTKAPKLNIEIWPVIDEWTKISIER